MYTFPAALLESMLLCKYIEKNYCMTLFFENYHIIFLESPVLSYEITYTHIRVYVFLYIYMYLYAYTAYLRIEEYMYSYACMCISLHTLVYVFVRTYVFSLCIYIYPYACDRSSTVVKVLRYKSEGRWFDPR